MNALETSPLIISAVTYDATDARRTWLQDLITKFVQILDAKDIPNERLHIGAYYLFERIKLFALFTKHHGFKVEREWRVVYMPDRDRDRKLEPMFQYAIGARGIEPILKFKVLPIEGVTAADLSLTKITDRIIMGPTLSSPIANATAMRMFDVLNHPHLKSKLRASTIPFRSIR